ncbi:hypothetical protein ACSBR2_037046 [Camellia fascicularis]
MIFKILRPQHPIPDTYRPILPIPILRDRYHYVTRYRDLELWLWGWSHEIKVPADDRTMFLTFSRGYPVSEVKELFTGCFGDCVGNVDMDEFNSVDQPLFAQMVVCGVSIVDDILKGSSIAKFWINGKHIWARKYGCRDG